MGFISCANYWHWLPCTLYKKACENIMGKKNDCLNLGDMSDSTVQYYYNLEVCFPLYQFICWNSMAYAMVLGGKVYRTGGQESRDFMDGIKALIKKSSLN